MSAIFGEVLTFGQENGPDIRLRVFGDELYARNAHEVTTSLGVRGREATPRNRFETLRLGLMARLGRGYKSAFVFTGIRF